MPIFLNAIRSSQACNIASRRPDAITSRSANHLYQSINKWITCTSTSGKKRSSTWVQKFKWYCGILLPTKIIAWKYSSKETLNRWDWSLQSNTTNFWCYCGTRRWHRIYPRRADGRCSGIFFILILYDFTEDLGREIDQIIKQQKTQQQTLQSVQDRNNEKLALHRGETHLTQESVKRIKEDIYTLI